MLAIAGGVVAGVFGGLILMLYMLFAALARGGDGWVTLKTAALPFLGQRASLPGFDAGAVVIGLLVHFALSMGWGAGFGLLAYRTSNLATIAFGAAYGVLVWILMSTVLLPAAGLGVLARSMPLGPALLQHIVFGLALAIGFLPFQKRA